MKHPILADLHTHAIASRHAYSTIKENVEAAKQRGMKFIASTDHVYFPTDHMDWNNEFGYHIAMRDYVPNVISGLESNLCHTQFPGTCQKLEMYVPWRLVGNHSWFLKDILVPDILVRSFKEAVEHDNQVTPTAFAHIERVGSYYHNGRDIDEVIDALYAIVDYAIRKDIYLEINNESLKRDDFETAMLETWVDYAVKHKARFCLGTDAHYCDAVGDFKLTEEFIEAHNVESCYILNCDESTLLALGGSLYTK